MTQALPQGGSSVVVRDGGVVLKTFRAVRPRRQAETALTQWGPALSALRVPRVRTAEDGDPPEMLRMEWLAGTRLSDRDNWRDDTALALALGQGLAELHALPCAEDSMPLAEAVGRRLEGWLKRDVGLDALGPARRQALRDRLDPSALDSLTRVPCHRDVGPENVLVAEGLPLALLDWEHAMADCAWVDLLRSWDGAPPDEDPWTASLAKGMGLRLSDWGALVALGLVEAAGCVVWGVQHGQPDRVRRGDALLEHLLGDRPARG